MPTNTRLDELLSLCEARHKEGKVVSLPDICRDCPELLSELQLRWQALLAWNAQEETGPDLNKPLSSGQATEVDTGRETADPATPSIPGYEVLGKLGRGGMGVVYKARQLSLNRVVALKMILSARQAGEEILARFRTEAEAVARLQHEGIAQVFEVGEQDGLPFFSLEFCLGGSLDRKLAGTPLPPMQAAALVEKLACAMHVAHQAHVIHRDLKPANILLAADGSPKIADFGLARKLDEPGRTQAGDIRGTPSYMAPEQARGKVTEMGPATDVYALGAILYECLTGRPPFLAANHVDTLKQVVSDDPAPPRRLNPQTPVDLETICLKCLRKESHKRYETALALAEDLCRYQAGEVIEARPVGQLERTWKWVRRNPALSGALAGAGLALVLGVVVSAAFAVDAAYQATQARIKAGEARDKEKLALDNEKSAIESETRAIAGFKEVDEAKIKVETALARSLVRSLGDKDGVALTDREIEVMWELTRHQKGQLGVRFVEEASRRPVNCRQLRVRAEVALHSAIGLSLKKRVAVEDLLRQRLDSGKLSEAEANDLALTLAALGDLSPETALIAARTLTQAMRRTTDSDTLREFAQGLAAVAARLEPREASRYCAEASVLLSQAISRTTNSHALESLAKGLATLAARLEPREACRCCTEAGALLSQALSRTSDFVDRVFLAKGLAAVAGRMEPRETATLLIQDISRTTDSAAARELAKVLATVAARLEPKEAATFLSQAMAINSTSGVHGRLAEGLVAAAIRLEPREAAALLIQAMSRTGWEVKRLAKGLVAVADRLEPKETATLLSQAMSRTSNSYLLQSLAESLAAVAARMEPREASRNCAATASLLSQAMSGTTDSRALGSLAESLAAVAARMEPREASRRCAEVVALLSQAMSRTTDSNALGSLAESLATVAARMEPREASRNFAATASLLSQAMSRTTDSRALGSLAGSLAAVAARMEPKEAASMLSQVMSRTTDSDALKRLAEGLAAVAARLEPREASRYCTEAAALLSQAISKTTDSAALERLAKGLATLAARLEPREASRCCTEAGDLLSQAMSRTTNSKALAELAQGLAAVAARLEPREASRYRAEATVLLSQATSRTTDLYALLILAESLAAVFARLEPRELSHRLQAVSSTVGQMTNPGPVGPWETLLPALKPMPPPLSAQDLVDLLKLPFCVGKVRRIVLDQLQRHYGRSFTDQWAFAHFAHEQQIELDLTTPAHRITTLHRDKR